MIFRDKELDDKDIEHIIHLLNLARSEIVQEIMQRFNLSQADACSLEWRLMFRTDECESFGWIA